MLAGPLLHLLLHGRSLTSIRALHNNPHSNDDSFGLIGGQFHVVGWPKAAIWHLHYPSLGVRGGGSRLGHLGPPCYGLGLLLPFLRRLGLGQVSQRLLHSLHPLPGRTLPCGPGALAHARVRMFPFLGQPCDLGPRLLQVLFQRLLPAEGAGAGTGSHSHPVLRHPLQGNGPGSHQRGRDLCQQLIQGPSWATRKSDSMW